MKIRKTRAFGVAASATMALMLFLATGGGDEDAAAGKSADATPQSFKIGKTEPGKAERGLAAFLICDGGIYKAGEPIAATFGVICVQAPSEGQPPPKPLNVLRPYPPADPNNRSWFSVIGGDAKEVPYQGEYIHWANARLQDVCALTQGSFVGQTFSELAPRHFDLRAPGKYRLRWHYAPGVFEGCWTGQLVSNEVEIEISPSK